MEIVPAQSGEQRTRKCRSCGKEGIKPRRRYCTDECRQQMQWVLSLSKGLLKVFNARYAAFTFNDEYVILDVLPVWSNQISRFFAQRTVGKKPAEDLKILILRCGESWYKIIHNQNSRSYASLCILRENHHRGLSPEAIRPHRQILPKFSRNEKISMKMLKLKSDELTSEGLTLKVKSAYKKLAKVYHPDMGGDEEKFKKLNDAHQHMRLWAEDPQFTSRKTLIDCWSYDGSTNRWSPPR